MKPVNEAKIKYGIWGLILGAVFAMIIGFGWGGWTTAGTTETLSKKAVIESQSAICVAQFRDDPNYKENLQNFEKTSSWSRSEFIEQGGWDKMPGQEKADYGVAQACASGLDSLLKE